MNIKDELRNHGLKATRQRIAVMTLLTEAEVPLSLRTIRIQLEAQREAMDLSTIYRILESFEESGLIRRNVHLTPEEHTYEPVRQEHRHYLLCVRCKKMIVLDGCPIHDYEHQIETETGFTIMRHQLELYGLCPECQKKTKHAF